MQVWLASLLVYLSVLYVGYWHNGDNVNKEFGILVLDLFLALGEFFVEIFWLAYVLLVCVLFLGGILLTSPFDMVFKTRFLENKCRQISVWMLCFEWLSIGDIDGR